MLIQKNGLAQKSGGHRSAFNALFGGDGKKVALSKDGHYDKTQSGEFNYDAMQAKN